MQDEIQKALELIEKAEHVAIFLPASPLLDCIAAAEVLASILQEKGKLIGFVVNKIQIAEEKKNNFPFIQSAPKLAKEFIVSLNTQGAPVDQLRYEKLNDRIDVIFSPKSSQVDERFISFREGKILCECALMFGIQDIDQIANIPELPPDFFTENSILNIDVSETNRRYGEVNLVDASRVSISEIVFLIAKDLMEKSLAPELATLLLSGIAAASNGFQAPSTGADTLDAAAELVRLGANHSKALEIGRLTIPLELVQLFGRISVRSKLDKDHGVLWAFATPEDFLKTGRSSADISQILDYLEATFPTQKVLIFLWHDPDESAVSVVLSGSHEIIEKANLAEQGVLTPARNSLRFLLEKTFPSFREAENGTSALLREIL